MDMDDGASASSLRTDSPDNASLRGRMTHLKHPFNDYPFVLTAVCRLLRGATTGDPKTGDIDDSLLVFELK